MHEVSSSPRHYPPTQLASPSGKLAGAYSALTAMTASPLRTPLRQCQNPSMIPSKAVSGEVPLIELKPRITPPFMPHLARPIANHLRRLGRVNTSRRSCCRRRRNPRLCRPDLAR